MVTINAQQLSTGWAVTVSCLSGDDKPNLFHPPGVFSAGLVPMPNGALLRELDTGKTYRFDADSAAWFPQPAAQDEGTGLGLTGASVGDLVRVNSVDANGTPTSWEHVPLNEIKCNKNLLDNWYFVGGGSQFGDGVFPINQRGQATYSGSGYGIDRWTQNTNNSMTLLSDGIVFASLSSKSRGFSESIENPQKLAGKTVTLSALIVSCDGDGVIGSTISGSNVVVSESGLVKKTFVIPVDIQTLEINGNAGANGHTIKIAAVKLELGSEQTLAHNEGTEENPVWVLNEIPDYGEELAKCQRYYQLFRTESLRPTYGEDCRPTMATEQPTKGTLTKDDVTYYTLSSES